jgi:hypothetical protein
MQLLKFKRDITLQLLGALKKLGCRTLPGLEVFRKRYKTKRSILIGVSGIGIKDFFETPILEWF